MRKVMILSFMLLVLAALGGQTPPSLSPAVKALVTIEAPLLALTHVRVIDGTGAPAREDQTIIVSGGKIQALGGAASTPVPPEAKVLDMKDYTVIPGLVGMHDHIFYPAGHGIFLRQKARHLPQRATGQGSAPQAGGDRPRDPGDDPGAGGPQGGRDLYPGRL